ncbi:MAG: hypothetical protein QM687_02345 [Ferruginibacter sp.]
MKKVLTIFSALLIVAGVKAQKANVQKETVKPLADTLIRKSVNTPVKNNASIKKAKAAPDYKFAPTIKKAAPANTTIKKAATQQ